MNRFINFNKGERPDKEMVMKKIKIVGHCPFCPENFNQYHKKPIIEDGKYWLLTENQWPYEKVKHQLLAIYKKHIEHISEIEPGAGDELFRMFKKESKERMMSGGGIVIRFGKDPEHGSYGNTVLHLHAHLIEPDLKSLNDKETWKIKLGQPKDTDSVSH